MRNFKRFCVPALAVSLFSLLVSVPPATAQSGTIMRPAKIEMPHSTTLPAACVVSEAYMDTDAPIGKQFYMCTDNSPVTWTLQGGFPGVFNVKDFGALGDGSTDDAAGIQSAIDTATALAGLGQGGEVLFPPGNYIIKSSINLKPFVKLRGVSYSGIDDVYSANNGVTITAAATFTGTAMFQTVAASQYWGVAIDSMRLIGSDLVQNGIVLDGTVRATIRYVSIQETTRSAVWLLHGGVLGRETVLSNVNVTRSNTDAAASYRGVFHIAQTDSFIDNCRAGGDDNTTYTNSGNLVGFYIGATGNFISNSYADFNETGWVIDSYGNQIVNSRADLNGGAGWLVTSGVYSGTCTGCYAANNSQVATNTYDAFTSAASRFSFIGAQAVFNGVTNTHRYAFRQTSAFGANSEWIGCSALPAAYGTALFSDANNAGGWHQQQSYAVSAQNDATPSIMNAHILSVGANNNTPTQITQLDDGLPAQIIRVVNVENTNYSYINSGGNFTLRSGNWVPVYGDWIELATFNGTAWFEISRTPASNGLFSVPSSTSLPATCTVGNVYFDTDATTGQNFYACTATNTWTLQGDGGGSIAFNNISGGTNTTATMIVGAGSSLSASGGTITATSILGSGVSGNITGNAAGLTGTLGVAQGGTNTTSYAQGDILYASAATTLSKLVKSTSADRYMCNTGASNNPAWCQIGLSTAGSFSGSLGATLGGTGLTSGTSGGINYWSSTTTQASSALLAANGVVIGGGAGVAPATSATTVTAAGSMVVPTGQSIDIAAHATDGGSLLLKEGADDGTNTFTLKVPDAGLTASKTVTLVAATGNFPASAVEDSGTNAKCARFNASGILVAASGDCSSGGGGTGTVEAVGAGCATGLCWTDGLETVGTRMWTWEGTTADGFETYMTVPEDPTADYELIIPNGTSAITFPTGTDTLIGKATTDTLTNKTLNAESTGNVLTTVEKLWLPAAGCNNATAASFWDLPTANAPSPNCVTGTNTQKAYLDFPDSDGAYSAQVTLALPSDWTGAIDAKIKWMSAITTGNVFWNLATICVADAETDDPAFNTASTVADTAKGTTNQTNDAAITGVTATGCAAGELLHLKISRDRTDGSDTLGASAARLIGVELTLRRAQ